MLIGGFRLVSAGISGLAAMQPWRLRLSTPATGMQCQRGSGSSRRSSTVLGPQPLFLSRWNVVKC
eukprot:2815782-Rhodomonas_salina.1